MAQLQNLNNINDNLNDNLDDIYDDWDAPATPVAEPVAPVIAPNGWHWYPDENGNLFSLYFDHDGNECMVWMQNNDGSYYWRCAGVGYNCRDIGIEGQRGIFFQDILVGTMLQDENLTVTWLPESYILPENQIHQINYINNINYYFNDFINDNDNINDNITDETVIVSDNESDFESDDYDP